MIQLWAAKGKSYEDKKVLPNILFVIPDQKTKKENQENERRKKERDPKYNLVKTERHPELK